MRSVINFVITLTAVTLLAACGNTQKPAEADPHAGHQHAPGAQHGTPVEKAAAAVSIKDDKLNPVYQHYIHLTTALVNGDIAEAKVEATAIALGSKDLSSGEKLTSLAVKIAAATDIEVQRTLLSDLSNDFISKVKQSGLTSGELYVEYCPMALKDKGAFWISNQKDIKNPYFGESMLTCGEVKETIK